MVLENIIKNGDLNMSTTIEHVTTSPKGRRVEDRLPLEVQDTLT